MAVVGVTSAVFRCCEHCHHSGFPDVHLIPCIRCDQLAGTKTDDGAGAGVSAPSTGLGLLPVPGASAPSSPDRIEAGAATLRVHLGYLAPERAAAAVAALDAYDREHHEHGPWCVTDCPIKQAARGQS